MSSPAAGLLKGSQHGGVSICYGRNGIVRGNNFWTNRYHILKRRQIDNQRQYGFPKFYNCVKRYAELDEYVAEHFKKTVPERWHRKGYLDTKERIQYGLSHESEEEDDA
jgi:hypothetical protein